MDLGFPLPDPADAAPVPATDLARLLAPPGERPAQAAPGEEPAAAPFASAGGAFNAAMAACIVRWGQG